MEIFLRIYLQRWSNFFSTKASLSDSRLSLSVLALSLILACLSSTVSCLLTASRRYCSSSERSSARSLNYSKRNVESVLQHNDTQLISLSSIRSLVSPLLEAVVLLLDQRLHPPLDRISLDLLVRGALPRGLEVELLVVGDDCVRLLAQVLLLSALQDEVLAGSSQRGLASLRERERRGEGGSRLVSLGAF